MLKIVVIGAGSSYTPELVEGIIKRYKTLPVKELWLVDIAEGSQRLNIIEDLTLRMVKKAGLYSNIKVFATLDRKEALKNADFVITQLRVGQMKTRILDEKIPFSHGVLGQETNGAGGLMQALRTVPVILDIAKDINAICPQAWLINFTNPSGIVTEALLRYGKHQRFVGLCNVPYHTEHMLAKIMGYEPERLRILFAGLNHMVYGLRVFIDGQDQTDDVMAFVTRDDFVELPTMRNVMPAKLDKAFLKGLGVLPCSYHNYFYHGQEMLLYGIKNYNENGTRAEVVAQVEKELFKLYKDPAIDTKPIQLESRGGAYYSDAACQLIDSIYNDRKDIQTVDTRNGGAIKGIDDDSAIEISAVITREGPIPLQVGALPSAVNGLVQQIKSFEIMAAEAAVEGNYNKAMVAMTINPLIPSDTAARILLDEMLQANKEYLPRFFNG